MTTGDENSPCGCCAGRHAATPEAIHNAPGLAAIRYRVGRHSTFTESLRTALAGSDSPALTGFGARDGADLTIALADGFAVMADIITFYQERIANEAFLRTATERRSVVELARLLGYQPSPGSAATTALAFSLERQLTTPPQPTVPVSIPAGAKVQSVPGPDESPCTFETVEAIDARVEWNAIPLQRTRPQRIVFGQRELVLDGTGHRLAAGDIILVVGSERRADPGSERWDVRLLRHVETDEARDVTRIRWAEGLGSIIPRVEPATEAVDVFVFRQRAAVFGHNAPDPRLLSTTGTSLGSLADVGTGQWNGFALGGRTLELDQPYPQVAPGGWIALVSDAISRARRASSLPGYAELYGVTSVAFPSLSGFGLASKVTRVGLDTDEHLSWFGRRDTLVLAQTERLPLAAQPILAPVYGNRIVLDRVEGELRAGQAIAVSGAAAYVHVSRSAPPLRLALDDGALVTLTAGDRLQLLAAPDRADGRGGRKAVDPDELEAAIAGADNTALRWRLADRDGAPGSVDAGAQAFRIEAPMAQDRIHSEIALIGNTADAVESDRDHTTIILQHALSRPYDRRTASINANVAAATHGETVSEILGSGDASRGDQGFPLKQAPLTWIAASTPKGRTSTLQVRIDDTRWAERPTLFAAGNRELVYTLRVDDDGTARVRFGDGAEGARLPTGRANVRASYRKGLGSAANLRAGQLSTLLSRPLGVTAVTNPAPALGGEDPENLDAARQNAPLTVLTLDRAVSRRDYEDYARGFPGITKAQAEWFPFGTARGVFITVAGPDGAGIPPGSPTHLRLIGALRAAGDQLLPLSVHSYRSATFRLDVGLTVHQDADADVLVAAARASLLGAFGWQSRAFGQPVSLDEVVAVLHRDPAILAVDVDVMRRTDRGTPLVQPRLPAARARPQGNVILPAELLTLDQNTLMIEVRS